MPAYNFKAQFAPLVASGAKRQTVRKPRVRATRPGELLHLYTGMRTASCRRLIEPVECLAVTPIMIAYHWPRGMPGTLAARLAEIGDYGVMLLGGAWLVSEAREAFARADGFASQAEFFRFFIEQYRVDERHLTAEVLYW